jgi:hypothetical protein
LRRLRQAGECALCIWSENDVAKRATADPSWSGALLDRLHPQGLIISRFAGAGLGAAISDARARRIPIITHLDDFLLEVPPDLGPEKIKQHMRPERLAALRESLEQADLLYISTDALAAKVRDAGISTPIVISQLQSCADPWEISPPPPFDPEASDRVRIGYQGTRSHIHDLRMLAPQLVAAMEARPYVTLTLFGSIEPPAELAPIANRVERLQPSGDYASFLTMLAEQRWDIGLAPLRDLEFNSFRTYTKWTEYSLSGVCVIATDCAVYRPVMADGAGLLVPNDGWYEGLLHLIDNALERREMVDKAQFMLRTKFSLRAQEMQLLDTLSTVIGR